MDINNKNKLQPLFDKNITNEKSAQLLAELQLVSPYRIKLKQQWDENEKIYHGLDIQVCNNTKYNIKTNSALKALNNKIANETFIKSKVQVTPIFYPTNYNNQSTDSDSSTLADDLNNINIFLNETISNLLNQNSFDKLKKYKNVYGSGFAFLDYSKSEKINEKNQKKILITPEIIPIHPSFVVLDPTAREWDDINWVATFSTHNRKDLIPIVSDNLKNWIKDENDLATALNNLNKINEFSSEIDEKVISQNAIEVTELDYLFTVWSANSTGEYNKYFELVNQYEYCKDENNERIVRVNIFVGAYFVGSVLTDLKTIPIIPLFDREDINYPYGKSELQTYIEDQKTLDSFNELAVTQINYSMNPILVFDNNSGFNPDIYNEKRENSDSIVMIGVDKAPAESFSAIPINPQAYQALEIVGQTIKNGIENGSGKNDAYYGEGFNSGLSGSARQTQLQRATIIDNLSIKSYITFTQRLTKLLWEKWTKFSSTIEKENIDLYYYNPNYNVNQGITATYPTIPTDLFSVLEVDFLIKQMEFSSGDEQFSVTAQLAQMKNLFPNDQLITAQELINTTTLDNKQAIIDRLNNENQQSQLHKAADIIKIVMGALENNKQAIQNGQSDQMIQNLPNIIAYIMNPNTPAGAADQLAQQSSQQQTQGQTGSIGGSQNDISQPNNQGGQ